MCVAVGWMVISCVGVRTRGGEEERGASVCARRCLYWRMHTGGGGGLSFVHAVVCVGVCTREMGGEMSVCARWLGVCTREVGGRVEKGREVRGDEHRRSREDIRYVKYS